MIVYFAGFVPCGQGYAVFFPDLPGCNSQGDTLPEAFSMAMEALAGHLEAMADDGDTIPAPSGETEAMRKFQEQFAGLDMGPMPEGPVCRRVPQTDARQTCAG